jgi:hypothetical protein
VKQPTPKRVTPEPLQALRDGWFLFQPGRGDAYIRFRERPDGRLVVSEMYLRADGGITSEQLRALPVARAEAAANSPAAKEDVLLASAIMTDAVEVPVLSRRGAGSDSSPIAFADISTGVAAPRLKLRASRGRARRADEFYRAVADAYSWLATQSKRPAAELAERNGVPVTTVHRWVKEARRRGFLGPGRRGGAS